MRAGLMERIRPTPADVRFLNDADAFGLGELRAGAASGHERAVVTTLGTGVGSAFLAAGSVIDDDPSVLPEGRLDLLAIDRRPLEELGRQAARLLLDRMNHRGAGESPARRIVIPATRRAPPTT